MITYNTALDVLGKSTIDPDLLAALRAMGVPKPPVIKRDRVSARLDVGALTLIFTDDSVYPSGDRIGDGNGVLTGLVVNVDPGRGEQYGGPLPFGVRHDQSRSEVRSRFGPPETFSEALWWDQWTRDGLILNVGYAEDFASVEAVTLMLPGTE